MNDNVIRLYPPPAEEQSLEGLYLAQDLRLLVEERRPFVYANFVTSLDGHISEPSDTQGRQVPKAIANSRDWRLYMELVAQADVLITTERQLRAMAAGTGQNFSLANSEHADLIAWRREHKLPEQPACAAISRSLQIPIDLVLKSYSGPMLMLTSEDAPRKQVSALEAVGIKVLFAGTGPRLSGSSIIKALTQQGYAAIYSVAGPKVSHTLLEADVLDRLYLTLTQVILGGEEYDTLTRGPAFNPPRGFKLQELYLDPHAQALACQLFLSFNRSGR
jgi:riboflavin biosynthesis pyrimidine reductase